MSKRMGTVWEAQPHTIAKIALLGRYLFVWFSMLGRTFRGKDLWYIDGFAGPGEYKNFNSSSPIAAINAAHEALLQTADWQSRRIRCLFIEEDKLRFQHLSDVVSKLDIDDRVEALLHHGTFADGINWLKRQNGNPFAVNSPLFSFIDPFGTKGLWFDVVSELLSRPACEALINFDSDGVGRVLKAGDDANHEQNLDKLFGTAEWRNELEPKLGLTELSRQAVNLYLRRLRSIPKVDYAFPFEMTSKRGLINYHLVFASQHPKGLEKMKESMKKIDQSGEYTFCDAHIGQQSLFQVDSQNIYADKLAERFRGWLVTFAEIEHFALNDSPFLNPKAMLKVLENAGRIEVQCSKHERRKGTFPDGSAISIRFLGEET